MSEAFVDTTILTNVLLQKADDGPRSRAALLRFERTLLPVYAIKEFCLGPFTNVIWLHNSLATHRSLSRTLAALHRLSLSPRRYRTSTALEMLATISARNTSLKALEEKYGPSADPDQVMADRFRLTLQRIIAKAWKNRRSQTSETVQALSCFPESDLQLESGLFKPTSDCQGQKACCLGPVLKDRLEDLDKLRMALLRLPVRRQEDERRLSVVKDLLRRPGELSQKGCRSLGDAYFALQSPARAVILTTNVRDHGPLASALGKAVEEP